MYGSDYLCPLCSTQARLAPRRGDYSDIECERCGRFRITGTAEACEKSPDLRRRLSGWVRDQNRAGVDLPTVQSYTDPPDPSMSQRIKCLLLEATHGLVRPEQVVGLGEPRFIAASYSSDHNGVIYLSQEGMKRGWWTKVFDQGPQIRITIAGHNAAARLRERSKGPPHGMDRIGF